MEKNKTKTIRVKKPWPTKDAMEQVYENNLWGKGSSEYYSGAGSHDLQIVEPYLEVVSSFLKSFEAPLIVCDLGCGDFNVGKELVQYSKNYIAVDIVPKLIAYNKEKFQKENLEFQCLNIAENKLPAADCVLLRQVLQHLSNSEVQRIVKQLYAFKYVIITEHLPEGTFSPNKDIISGQGIRLKKNSGIDLLASPFNFKVQEVRELLALKSTAHAGLIVTTLYRIF